MIMLILVGYTSNAAGILIFPAHAGTILMSHNQEVGADGSGSAAEALAAEPGGIDAKRAVALAADWGLRELSRRAEEGGDSERPILVEVIGSTGYWFAEGYHRAVYSSIAFYLSAKVLKLLVHFVYGLMLPKFRTALWVEMVPIFLLACTYLPLAFVYNPGWICGIIVAGIIIDLFSKYLINGFLQRVHRYYKRKGKPIFIPAQSVEHIAEGTGESSHLQLSHLKCVRQGLHALLTRPPPLLNSAVRRLGNRRVHPELDFCRDARALWAVDAVAARFAERHQQLLSRLDLL